MSRIADLILELKQRFMLFVMDMGPKLPDMTS
jgi:hypothetical protein